MIQYVIEQRHNVATGQKEYFPKIVRATTLPTKEIAELLAHRTTLSEAEVYSFLAGLSDFLIERICDSYIVRLEGFGTFSPAIKATPQPTEKDVKASTITTKTVNFRPSATLRQSLQNPQLRKANLNSAHL